MNFKQLMSFLVYLLILSFAGALFSSYAASAKIVIYLGVDELFLWLQDNWALVALVVSEIAGLLPGKPKGILHALLKIGNKIYVKPVERPKNVLL